MTNIINYTQEHQDSQCPSVPETCAECGRKGIPRSQVSKPYKHFWFENFYLRRLMLTGITGYFAQALSAIEKKATHLILLSSMLREVFFFLFLCFCVLSETMIPESHFSVWKNMAPPAELWVNPSIHLSPYRGFDRLICNARTFVNEFLTGCC